MPRSTQVFESGYVDTRRQETTIPSRHKTAGEVAGWLSPREPNASSGARVHPVSEASFRVMIRREAMIH